MESFELSYCKVLEVYGKENYSCKPRCLMLISHRKSQWRGPLKILYEAQGTNIFIEDSKQAVLALG